MTFRIHNLDTAPEDSKKTLQAIGAKYGFVPNLAGVFAESPGALHALLGAIGAFEGDGMTLSAIERHVVLLAASVSNRCQYCTAAHSMVATMSGLERVEVDKLQQGQPLANPRLEALRRFVGAVTSRHGWITKQDLETFAAAGFGNAEVLEVVLGVALKTLTNYVNHIAKPPVNDQLAAFLPAWDAVA